MLLPMNALRSYGTQSATAFGAVIRNPNLRWLELAWTASVVGHYAYLIAVSVYAYGVGGEKAVGLVFLARLIPAALAAPFAGLLGDRYRRERVLLVTNLTRIVLVVAAALGVFLDAQPAVVYVLAIAATIAYTPFRPAAAALTPALARSPGRAHRRERRCGRSLQPRPVRRARRSRASSSLLRAPALCSS